MRIQAAVCRNVGRRALAPRLRGRPLLVILLLSIGPGCAPAGRETTLKDDSAESPAASGPADAAAAGDLWRVDGGGIGPVRAGMSLAAARTALGSAATLPASKNPECDYVRPEGGPSGVAFMVVGDTVVRVDVRDSSVTTVEGARIGDSESRIRALYGERVISRPHKYTHGRYLVVPKGAGPDTLLRLVFETDSAGKVTEFRSGRVPEVEYVEGCS